MNQSQQTTLLTIRDVASRTGLSMWKVRSEIEEGRLKAVLVSAPGSQRPRYRVLSSDLEMYIRQLPYVDLLGEDPSLDGDASGDEEGGDEDAG